MPARAASASCDRPRARRVARTKTSTDGAIARMVRRTLRAVKLTFHLWLRGRRGGLVGAAALRYQAAWRCRAADRARRVRARRGATPRGGTMKLGVVTVLFPARGVPEVLDLVAAAGGAGAR